MAIHVRCAACGAEFQAADKFAGHRVKCPTCSAVITVGEAASNAHGPANAAEEKTPLVPVACGCGKKLRVKAELAGKRVKCPACGAAVTVPGPRPAPAQPADELDLGQLAGFEAVPAAPLGGPLSRVKTKEQPSHPRLIVGLSVAAGVAVFVLLLVVLLWPSGEDNELATEGAAPGGKSQETAAMPAQLQEIPAQLKQQYAWLEGSAPFDVAKFLAPIPEEKNAAPLYLDGLVEFDNAVLMLLVSDKQKLDSALKERQPEQRKRSDQMMQFEEAWDKNPASVDLRAVDAWLKGYEIGFEKLAEAQKRSACMFTAGFGVESFFPHAQAAREAARVVKWRNRRDLSQGNFDRPIQGVETILRLSRDLRRRAPGICQLVSVAVDGICCQSLPSTTGLSPDILSARGITVQHCDRLLAALVRHEVEAVDPFLESQRVEYLRTRRLLSDFQYRTGVFDQQGYAQLRQDFGGSVGSTTFLFPISSLAMIWSLEGSFDNPHRLATEKYGKLDAAGAMEGSGKSAENWRRLLAMSDADHAKELEAVNRVWAAILGLESKTLLERQRAIAAGSLLDPLRETSLALFFEPDFRSHQAFLRSQAALRGTQCLVALRRWQLEQRQPPKDLQAVAKAAGMSGVPIDPYSDQPMRMATIQGQPVIYSVGPDEKDDQAQPAQFDQNSKMFQGDFVFPLQPPK